MKPGDTVKVYPHGSPDQFALAKVQLLDQDGLSIAVSFQDKPSFVRAGDNLLIGPYGISMLATRIKLYGKPWGPWVDTFGGGHYEIEEVSNVRDPF